MFIVFLFVIKNVYLEKSVYNYIFIIIRVKVLKNILEIYRVIGLQEKCKKKKLYYFNSY